MTYPRSDFFFGYSVLRRGKAGRGKAMLKEETGQSESDRSDWLLEAERDRTILCGEAEREVITERVVFMETSPFPKFYFLVFSSLRKKN